jgi:hypothetical protein
MDMAEVTIHLYGTLNELVPRRKRSKLFHCPADGRTTLKHAIEALGVPHTEVGLVTANGSVVQLDYIIQSGDQVDVYPKISGEHPPYQEGEEPRFVLDNHLGRLAAYLRMLGFDAIYSNGSPDEELARIASQEKRILLTRDRGLLKRKAIQYGYCVLQDDPTQQLLEVVRYYRLSKHIHPFQRCLRCNTLLEAVDKRTVEKELQPQTRWYYDEFRQCPQCKKVYWKGSHYRRMQRLIEQVVAAGDQMDNNDYTQSAN